MEPFTFARTDTAGGEAFMAYVLGRDGQATLARWGFLAPDASGASATVPTSR
jgi:hypothetical protein